MEAHLTEGCITFAQPITLFIATELVTISLTIARSRAASFAAAFTAASPFSL